MEAVLARFRAQFRTQLAESEPSDRSFGFLAAAGLVALGLRHRWVLGPGAALFLTAALFPPVLRGPKRAWLFCGYLLSLIANPLVLGILFFGVMTPVGWLMRAVGRDPLHLKPSARSPTYWIVRAAPTSDMNEEF
jgi:hypothetical protein